MSAPLAQPISVGPAVASTRVESIGHQRRADDCPASVRRRAAALCRPVSQGGATVLAAVTDRSSPPLGLEVSMDQETEHRLPPPSWAEYRRSWPGWITVRHWGRPRPCDHATNRRHLASGGWQTTAR